MESEGHAQGWDKSSLQVVSGELTVISFLSDEPAPRNHPTYRYVEVGESVEVPIQIAAGKPLPQDNL
jgi:hypothetical protein